MIKYLLIPILLLSPVLLSGQNKTINQMDSNGKKTGFWIVNDEKGNIRYKGSFADGHPVDSLFRYYPDGTLKAVMVYDKTGIKVDSRIYDEKGRLRAEGQYINQLKEGPWVFYGTSNNKFIEVRYTNDKLSGTSTRYYANGQPMEKTNWKGNLLDGLQVMFNEDGKKISEYYYRLGELSGAYFVYFDSGQLAVKGTYMNNLKHGEWTYFHPNGDLDYAVKYVKGKPVNTEILDQRQKMEFDRYNKNKNLIKDPLMYLSNPSEFFRK